MVRLEAGVVTKSYTTSVTLTADTIYSFKVSSRNTVGISTQSELIKIRAARAPDAPTGL